MAANISAVRLQVPTNPMKKDQRSASSSIKDPRSPTSHLSKPDLKWTVKEL